MAERVGDGGDARDGVDETDGSDEPTAPDTAPPTGGDVEPEFDADERVGNGDRPVVRDLRERIESLDPVARAMVAYYREYGPASPLDAHVAAGGDGDRTAAYRRNGELRERDLIEHAGRGGYTTCFRATVREAHDDRLDEADLEAAVSHVLSALPPARPPESIEEWPDAYRAAD
ncbi:hypothetical protein ACFQL2_14550 [Halosegnis marinus]